jgi:hypothetical protein
MLRNISPFHKGEARILSRRKPLGFLPNAFIASSDGVANQGDIRELGARAAGRKLDGRAGPADNSRKLAEALFRPLLRKLSPR